jgi:tetratricopeptide (TPR) repeat protein
MGALLVVYEKAGRQADALWLLDESPWWPSADLGDQQMESGPIPAAGRVLMKADRKAEAAELLKVQLRIQPSDDEAYEVLVPLQGTNLLEWLDALYAKDRFEERPLIWKAVVLKDAGRLDEAETVIRQALKVDPTDGEQEPGQRVKSYTVLGDILEAKGRADDAKFFRNVVKAVRIAEEGDEFSEMGLISRSLKKYEEAEGLFVDAYCVQWRLAERLWTLGKLEEANRHYAIAFERMPEQFGQVASFCFGCQGVFEKEQSRSVAEQVLTRLAETQGQRPQVHFLLGQLREAQSRYADAYQCFKRAIELDPDYLDAWEKLCGLNEELYLPKKERDDIVLRGMELDPSRRHFGGGWETVLDVRRLWALAARGAAEEKPAGNVFQLKGTAQAIAGEKAMLAGPDAMMTAYSYRRHWRDRDAPAKPAVLLLRHQMVQALMNYLQ